MVRELSKPGRSQTYVNGFRLLTLRSHSIALFTEVILHGAVYGSIFIVYSAMELTVSSQGHKKIKESNKNKTQLIAMAFVEY